MLKRASALLCVALLAAYACADRESEISRLEQELQQLQEDSGNITVGDIADVVEPATGRYEIVFGKDRYFVDAGGRVSVDYSLASDSSLEVIAKDGWNALVETTDAKTGKIVVTCPDPAVISDIVVKATASDGRCTSAILPLMVRDPYTDATRKDVAALAYYCFDTDMATDYNFKMMADAGFNMLTIESDDNWQEQLVLAHKYGLKGILFINGPAGTYYYSGGTSTLLAEVVNEAKTYPALYGYQIADEPFPEQVEQLVFERNAVKALDPDRPVYINMYPGSTSYRSPTPEDYEEYVRSYATRCELEFITFDQYPVMTTGIDPSWSTSLNIIRNISRERGVPFWAFTLCCREYNREDPTLANIRLQCNTNLAYGAQVNQFFVYRSTSGTDFAPMQTWEWADQAHEEKRYFTGNDVKYTAAYDACKAYNTEMHHRGFVFAGCDAYKLRHTVEPDLYGYFLAESDLPPQISSFETETPTLVSFVENDGNQYMVVVNKSWTDPVTVDMTVEDMIFSIDRDGVFAELLPGEHRLTIDEGDMLVLKYR